KIFLISCAEDLEVIKSVLGQDFLNLEGWPRVNSGIASLFVENLLVLHPSKADVVNVMAHWLCPTFCGNLTSEVANLNMVSWSAQDVSRGSSSGAASAFLDLECHFNVLMEFSESLSSYAKDKNSGCIVYNCLISKLWGLRWFLFRLGGMSCIPRRVVPLDTSSTARSTLARWKKGLSACPSW
ncbi:hypothetical protein KI387_014539, partial [Taxus chinensis]